MSDCAWQGQEHAGRIECFNTTQLYHSGVVPVSICGICPYKKQPNYLTATSRLMVTQQRQHGPYRPAPKSCGGCGTVKRRDTATQFVWPYFAGAASGDELRFSIRSVERFFDGPVKITLVGDRPPWFRGHVIQQPRIAMVKHWGFRDMLAKMQTMSEHPEIDSEFVWMMDDVYFLKPTSWDDIETPRAYPWHDGNGGNAWHKIKRASMAALKAKGLPNHDYATHAPHTVEKSKLRQLFTEFDLSSQTLTWEILYGNRYRGRPYGTRPWFVRLMRPMNAGELQAALAEASVCNHLAELWTPVMRQYLVELLPEPSLTETIDCGYRPQFKTRGRQPRVVKRRPPETWRKNIERAKRAARNTDPVGVQ